MGDDEKTWPKTFDGHNDLVLRLMRGDATAEGVAAGLPDGHIDLPRSRRGRFGGGFFAIFVPSDGDKGARYDEMQKPRYDLPLPHQVPLSVAQEFVWKAFDMLEDLQDSGAVALCRTSNEIAQALDGDRMAAVIHLEGAEAIDREFETLHALHARGLRSLGPVWSRETIFGHGVPFRYPASPDTGPGLTEAGKQLIKECNGLAIMIDLSHLNERGFDDVAALSDAPLVATHSNAWSVCPHARNLTDRQLALIGESDGMVGINFASAFLRPDGRMDANLPVEDVLHHLDHLIETVGEDRVGLGSDFDGALVPDWIEDCAGLPNLWSALRQHGVNDALMKKLAHENWLRVLRKTWSQ